MKTKITNIQELASYLKSLRKAQNLTQNDLAGITGLGRRFISDVENAKETAQIGKILHLLNSLGAVFSISKEWRK